MKKIFFILTVAGMLFLFSCQFVKINNTPAYNYRNDAKLIYTYRMLNSLAYNYNTSNFMRDYIIGNDGNIYVNDLHDFTVFNMNGEKLWAKDFSSFKDYTVSKNGTFFTYEYGNIIRLYNPKKNINKILSTYSFHYPALFADNNDNLYLFNFLFYDGSHSLCIVDSSGNVLKEDDIDFMYPFSDENNNIYFYDYSYIKSYNSSWQERWKFSINLKGTIKYKNNKIHAYSNNYAYIINPDTGIKEKEFSFNTGYNNIVNCVIDNDYVFYQIKNCLYVKKFDGTLILKKDFGEKGLTFDVDWKGNIIIKNGNCLSCYDISDNILWQSNFAEDFGFELYQKKIVILTGHKLFIMDNN